MIQFELTHTDTAVPDVDIDIPEISQIALVVEDLEEAMDRYRLVLGLEPWEVYRVGPPEQETGTYYGQSANQSFDIGDFYRGDLEIEIIEPIDGPSVHRDFLEEGGEGIHHVTRFDFDDPYEIADAFEDAGVPMVRSGRRYDTHYVYVDTTEILDGIYFETLAEGDVDPGSEHTYPGSNPRRLRTRHGPRPTLSNLFTPACERSAYADARTHDDKYRPGRAGRSRTRGGARSMTYRVGFLGYGLMGKAHANALDRLPMFFPDSPETNRHVLVGRDEDALAAAAERYGFDRTATDWREVIEDVDILYNLTPNHLHADPTIAALEADTHVLCEKPLASNLDDAKRMVDAAASADAVAACAFNYRFVPAIRLIKRLVEDGVIGDIRHFRGFYLQDFQAAEGDEWIWRNDVETAGYGRVGDVGAHTIDLARWLVGDVSSVSGTLSRFVEDRPHPDDGEPTPVTTDDAYAALLEFESGTQGVVEGSRVATGHQNTNVVELIGTDGAVRYDVERFNELELKREGDRGFQRINVTNPDDPYMSAWWPAGHGIGWEHTFVHENYEFLTSVETGDSYAPDFDDALAVQRVVDAVVESDDRGTWVEL